MTTGKNLKRFRKRRFSSTDDFATELQRRKELGEIEVSATGSYIRRIERDAVASPGTALLRACAYVLGVKITDLIEDYVPEEPISTERLAAMKFANSLSPADFAEFMKQVRVQRTASGAPDEPLVDLAPPPTEQAHAPQTPPPGKDTGGPRKRR